MTSPTIDYIGFMVGNRAELEEVVAVAQRQVDAHKCAIGQTIKWQCAPAPGRGFMLHVSWPCDGDE